MELDTITNTDALTFAQSLPADSVNCVVTSPPYFGLRDYGVNGQIGNEETYQEYIANMTALFCEVLRVLKPDGVMWLNLGDSYAGSRRGWTTSGKSNIDKRHLYPNEYFRGQQVDPPAKSLIGIPHRVRFALQDTGWIARQDVIWHKPNAMPESVTDRPTTAHEYIFLMTKTGNYYYDAEAIKEPVTQSTITRLSQNIEAQAGSNRANGGTKNGTMKAVGDLNLRNKRSVWSVSTAAFTGAHFAVFPESLIEPMIKAGCPRDGIVFDPFMGSGTTALVARRLNRHFIGSELNADYVALAEKRLTMPYQTYLFA
jgi:DNA modification methylase